MTVFYFTNLSFPDGGMASGNRVLHLARGLVSKGIKVIVLSPFSDSGKAERFERDGIVFHSFCRGHNEGLRQKIVSSFLYPLKAFRVLRREREKETLIYSYTGNIFHEVAACLFSRLLKMPIAREGCEFPYTVLAHAPRILQWLEVKFCMRFYAGVVAITQSLEEYYRKVARRGCDVIHIPMTVDCDRFAGQVERPFDFDYIAYTGSMNRKGGGVDVLVKAFSILAKDYPDLHLVLIGKGSFRRQDELLGLSSADVRKRIHCLFSGTIPADDMPRYIKNAKILTMLPSLTFQQEGCFPTKLGEYLASGVPTLVTQIGIPAKILVNRENVFFTPPDDPVRAKEILSEMLVDYATAKGVAGSAMGFAKQHFHYALFANQMADWVSRIIGGGK